MPGWSAQTLRQHFGDAMEKLAEVEPMAELFIQDQLRGSPVLFYAQVLDRLSRDANRLAGVQHRLLGRDVGAGLNALNPGLARGVLHAAPAMKQVADFARDGIYLLPETVAALPPVAGILTTGAGNPLSHVQLLARNLGIPNVAVDESLVAALRPADGKRVVLAVSPAGLVELAEDGPAWASAFAGDGAPGRDVVFSPDLAKLDLSMRDFVSLDTLRARDSGRIVGPKAAKLGELRATLSGPRGARRGHPVRRVPRDRARPPVPQHGPDGVPVDGRALPRRSRRCRPARARPASSPRSCARRSTRSCGTPSPGRSSASG